MSESTTTGEWTVKRLADSINIGWGHTVEAINAALAAERKEVDGLKDANRGLCIESNERYHEILKLREQLAAANRQRDAAVKAFKADQRRNGVSKRDCRRCAC